MGRDPADSKGGPDDEAGPASRQTIKPSFDLQAYAEDSDIRERLPTISDESAIEEARIASVLMDSTPPRAPAASAPDVQVVYSEVDALGPEEHLAVLRDRLAPLSRVPTLSRPLSELGPIIEDPRSAFVLGFVDGLLPLETIVDVAGMPELDVLRVLDRAIAQGVVVFPQK